MRPVYFPQQPPYLKYSAAVDTINERPQEGLQEADAAAGGAGPTPLAQRRRFSSTNRMGSFHQLFVHSESATDIANTPSTSPRRRSMRRRVPSTGEGLVEDGLQSPPQTTPRRQLRLVDPVPPPQTITPDWRLRDRMKTVGVGLVLCLNVGTDPPDVVKPHPCAVLQCWMNPLSVSRSKARELIGELLEQQYAKWQLARSTARPLRHRRATDPTVEDVRQLCLQLRRQARNERVLLHYNGHGVPRPTDHGEIWVFDKNHTEYIPLPVQDMRQWMGKPSIVVLDCSSAGVLLPYFTKPLPAAGETTTSNGSASTPQTMEDRANQWVRDTIVLCPCDAGELLPMDPDYPADIFTSCLTTPIPMALQWFLRRNPTAGLDPNHVEIPGKAGDRKTPLGELNWIFTAVTDSIAWNVLPKYLFQRLFRQDLLVASMFRNFLLADRILRHLGCTPVSYPPLPSTSDHPLWEAWDLACETLLFQLVKDGVLQKAPTSSKVAKPPDEDGVAEVRPMAASAVTATYSVSSPFFSEQLTAFEVWLDFASIHKIHLESGTLTRSPEQLPVVLQVLLSQIHRIRALMLLRRFLDLGPWAVNLSLSLGIFPYVMKLLQSPEYKSLLVSIWASILAFDPSCRVDLLKDGAFHHFVQHLMFGLKNSNVLDIAGAARERALAAFVLANACHEYPAGQSECVRLNLHGNCCALLSSYEQGEKASANGENEVVELHLPAQFRLWLVLCLASMVVENRPLQLDSYNVGVHQRLALRLADKNTHVRAAVCYAFGCLIGRTKPPGSRTSSQQDLTTSPLQKTMAQPSFLAPAQPLPNVVLPDALAAAAAVTTPLQPSFGTGAGMPSLNLAPQQAGQPAHHFQGLPQQVPQGHPSALQGQAQAPFWNPAQQGQIQLRPSGQPMQASYLIPPGQPMTPAGLGTPTSFLPTLMDPGASPFPQMQDQTPSVFEDRQRLEFDLFSLDMLSKATNDASVVVRYEAVMGLACAVGKYLEAFVVVAEESLAGERQHSTDRLLGLDIHTIERFRQAWTRLRSMQKEEFFPSISKAVNEIVRVVNEQLLTSRADNEPQGRRMSEGGSLFRATHNAASALAGIDENGESGGLTQLPSSAGKYTPAPRQRAELRRVSTETGSLRAGAVLGSTESLSGTAASSAKDVDAITYTLPSSEFFQWKTSSFDHSFRGTKDEAEMDPLSPVGSAKLYQDRRNAAARDNAREITQRYASLAPKPPKATKRGIDLILEDEEDSEAALAAEVELSAKKRELRLKESQMLRNDEVKMTSMLSFHPFEEYLVACDGSNIVSLWDTKKGRRIVSFKNGNSQGTRMTASCWINESSQSLFLVGSDDGAVRLWGGLAEPPNGCSNMSPSLVSSFPALPMVDGQRPSGLVVEWQPFGGRLIAAGSSKYLRSWDLESEQLSLQVETHTDAHITTLTTAWEHDPVDTGNRPQTGIGPDIVVAGMSDGALRIFDIRTPRAAAQDLRRGRRATQYSEHKNWVVTTAFTNYSHKYEVVSGTLTGEIKSWDLRMSSSIRTIEAQRRTMTTLAIHPKIPIMATGSHAQFIKILTPDGDTLQVLRYHERLANHRIGPVSCVAFHPFKPLLAAGATDSLIGLYAPKAQ